MAQATIDSTTFKALQDGRRQFVTSSRRRSSEAPLMFAELESAFAAGTPTASARPTRSNPTHVRRAGAGRARAQLGSRASRVRASGQAQLASSPGNTRAWRLP